MAEPDAKLTPFHNKVLTQYQTFHACPPSVARLMALSVRGHIMMVVVSTVAAILCFSIDGAPFGYTVIGMLIGGLSRDIGQFRRLTKAWPLLNRIIDWATVNTLLNDSAAKAKA